MLGLLLLAFIDTSGFTSWSWSALPALFLLVLPPVQCVLYQLLVREGSEHRFTWGLLATIIPVRFLDVEKKRARNFLILSQAAWFLTHLCCWLGYSLYVFLAPPGSVVMFSLYLPVLVPLLLLPPALASLHWSTSLAPLYDSYHAHPDMEDTRTREKTFPPDWGHISGSQLAPKHMADAGFFYSCRRLRTSEATCYSCGRQVTEWTGRTAQQAHRQIADHCPFYSQQAPNNHQQDPQIGREKGTSIRVSETIFIASTVIFRVASFALLIFWVFWDHWSQVSPALLTQYILPPLYLLLLLLLNPAIYYSCLGSRSSLLLALLSILAPIPSNKSLPSSRLLLTVNVTINTLVHVLLWAAMIGTCPSCALFLSGNRLLVACPVVLCLALVSALSALPYWYQLSLRSHQPAKPASSKTVYVVSTAL